ncbi:MAG: di-trans,poly-cis-decaprenylcistransferase [Chryseobacterium sp.]|nr:MAG: di-trans,poly-cis-decaprenylcistransferase [Chryseobacterium sp.]
MPAEDLPKHIGFILDGNRRWASQKGLPKLVGHKKGYENLKKIAEDCFDMGIEVVSAYIFSTENWKREETEVSYLMDLALKIFSSDLDELIQKGIRVVVSGTKDKLDPKIVKAIDESTERTADNHKGTINLCFNYGGQQEIADAVVRIIDAGLPADSITPAVIRDHLYHPELPPVDYIVRTSGEQRLSNFLLWDSAYAELQFVPVHWPAFKKKDLVEALDEYRHRQRRFGGK